MKSRPVLALTMGDPAGIGPEICARALREPSVVEQCVPVVFGDAGVLRSVDGSVESANALVVSPAAFNDAREWTRPVIVDCRAVDANAVAPGVVSPDCGRAGYRYVEAAIESALRGRVSGVVTAPIHKEALALAGVPHPGHTEIFTALTGAKRSCMMLWSETITVSMATTHIGFQDVPGRLSVDRIVDVIELTDDAMRRLLKRVPRIGVCGLNPHAGEHGLFGNREEERFVEPAIQRTRKRGLDVEGPLVPDAAFTPAQRKRFDAFVTLYHDQGHIPFKMLAFDTGVNITLGLPIVRTSVDHGTAFDIAWKGLAHPGSLYAAIRVAATLAADRPATAV